jgi:hypothetical protein
MSKLETNTIDTVSGTSTLQVGSTNTSTITLGASGDTINIPSGATIANSGTATGFGGVNTPAFRAYRNGNVTLSNATNTIITFNSENFDTGGMYDTSNGKFTPTEAGKYFLFTWVKWNLNGGTNYIEIRQNGSNKASMYTTAQNSSGDHVYQVATVVEANANDYFEVNVYQGSGSNKTLAGGNANTFFGGYKIIE